MLRRMLNAPVPGKRRREDRGPGVKTDRPTCKRDTESVVLKEEGVGLIDWAKWNNDVQDHSGDPN